MRISGRTKSSASRGILLPVNTCLRVALDLVLIRSIVNAAEVLGSRKDYQKDGIFSWTVMRLQKHWQWTSSSSRPAAVMGGETFFLYLNGIQIVLCILLIVAPAVYLWLLWPVFAGELFVDQRNSAFGRDGSDRMHILAFLALCVSYSFTDLRARTIGLI